MNVEILKVLVGSRAHGLANDDSDYDYRGVFVAPTEAILSIGGDVKSTSWIEGKEDDTSWEIGKFLQMAVKCNPTILEVFVAPVILSGEWGDRFRALFPAVWNSHDVYNAFRGYGMSQRKKFLDDKDGRAAKFAVAYIRSLYCGAQLLLTGVMPVYIADSPVGSMLARWRQGDFTHGEVIDQAVEWEARLTAAYRMREDGGGKETDLIGVNNFLMDVRQEFFWGK